RSAIGIPECERPDRRIFCDPFGHGLNLGCAQTSALWAASGLLTLLAGSPGTAADGRGAVGDQLIRLTRFGERLPCCGLPCRAARLRANHQFLDLTRDWEA